MSNQTVEVILCLSNPAVQPVVYGVVHQFNPHFKRFRKK